MPGPAEVVVGMPTAAGDGGEATTLLTRDARGGGWGYRDGVGTGYSGGGCANGGGLGDGTCGGGGVGGVGGLNMDGGCGASRGEGGGTDMGNGGGAKGSAGLIGILGGLVAGPDMRPDRLCGKPTPGPGIA